MARANNNKCPFRQSISFTEEQHQAINEMAERYNVSFCWIVRYACDQLLKQHTDTNTVLDLVNSQSLYKHEANNV